LACATALTYSVHAQGGSYRVFVTNEASGDLTVIDGSNQQAIANWRLGKRPRGIVAAPDGQHLYVAVSGSPLGGPGVDEKSLPPPDKSADGIDVVNVMTGKVERVLTGVSDPEQLAVSADGTRLYVASEDSSSLVVIRASDGKVLKRAAAGGEPEGVAVSASAKLVGVTSETSNMVTLMDSAHFQIVGRVPVGLRPRDIAFSADGGTAYVSGENDASLTVIDVMSRKTVRTVHFTYLCHYGTRRPRRYAIRQGSHGECIDRRRRASVGNRLEPRWPLCLHGEWTLQRRVRGGHS
jgi:YVTN family beta-propeller protein